MPCGSEVSAAVREKKEAEQLREVRGLSKMQRAKFQIKDQNAGVRFRTDDVARKLERVNRRIAAHEANDCSLDRSG
jgi:hypothetical protein